MRRHVVRGSGLSLLLLGGLALTSCGGSDNDSGGGGGTMPSTCLGFQAAAAPALPHGVARTGSGSSCDTLVVEVALNGVSDVFAVQFDVGFNTALASYQGYSIAGSHLASDGAQLQVFEANQGGTVTLGVTRTMTSSGVDFNAGQTVVKMIFRKALSSGSSSDSLTFANQQVFDSGTPPVEIGGITWAGGTLQVN